MSLSTYQVRQSDWTSYSWLVGRFDDHGSWHLTDIFDTWEEAREYADQLNDSQD